jgi:predicted TIM-barrel fold metal-dependent hydrolase
MKRDARPSRRELLVAGAAALGCAAVPERADAVGPPPAGPAATPAGRDVDVHCHVFCSADLPIVGFVAHYIPGLTEVSRFVTRWPEVVVRALVGVVAQLPNAAAPTGDAELASLRAMLASATTTRVGGVVPLPPELLDQLLTALTDKLPFSIAPEKRKIVARVLDALYLTAHPRASIAASLAETFPSVTLFTPALVDYDAWSDDRAPTPLATQILVQEAIARLSVQGRIGRSDARFHPFVAFDPRRQAEATPPAAAPTPAPATPAPAPAPATVTPASTALEMVRYAIERAGFVGVKVYPPVGFAPLDNASLRPHEALSPRIDGALRALYAYCQAEEVPITTHASAANEYGLGLRVLVAPERWRPALDAYPALRLNLGHFGHDYGVIGPGATEGWIYQGAALIQRFPNVYADLANSPLVYDAAYAARLVALLRDVATRHPRVKRRLMYGSDWWLSRLDPDAGLAVERFRSTLANLFSPDEVADVMGRNALRFLGLLDDENRPRPGRAAARLRRFYGAAPLPAWLA